MARKKVYYRRYVKLRPIGMLEDAPEFRTYTKIGGVRGHYYVELQIAHQGFRIREFETLHQANWHAQVLRLALRNLVKMQQERKRKRKNSA